MKTFFIYIILSKHYKENNSTFFCLNCVYYFFLISNISCNVTTPKTAAYPPTLLLDQFIFFFNSAVNGYIKLSTYSTQRKNVVLGS